MPPSESPSPNRKDVVLQIELFKGVCLKGPFPERGCRGPRGSAAAQLVAHLGPLGRGEMLGGAAVQRARQGPEEGPPVGGRQPEATPQRELGTRAQPLSPLPSPAGLPLG